jgi:hypothetical protein
VRRGVSRFLLVACKQCAPRHLPSRAGLVREKYHSVISHLQISHQSSGEGHKRSFVRGGGDMYLRDVPCKYIYLTMHIFFKICLCYRFFRRKSRRALLLRATSQDGTPPATANSLSVAACEPPQIYHMDTKGLDFLCVSDFFDSRKDFGGR